MQISGNTILITGGATGIGFSLARRFVNAGSRVIVCSRRPEQLERACKERPGLEALQCDVSRESERLQLLERIERDFPALSVLVNNAGIQNRPPRFTQPQNWAEHKHELATNLEAPMHLSMLFLPLLLRQPRSALINITSGLAFMPLAGMATYCATKAALHSFTLSLRFQLRNTPVEVIEVAPPAVNTDLGGPGLHTFGVDVEEFTGHVVRELEKGQTEIAYGSAEEARTAGPEEHKRLFLEMNSRFSV